MAEQPREFITYRTDGPITIGRLINSNMLDGDAVTQFGDQLATHCGEHPGIHLLLDFGQVDYLSSAALSELIRSNDSLVANGGALRVAGLSPNIYEVFKITTFDKIFDIHAGESVEAAVTRFKRSLVHEAEEDAWRERPGN